MNNFEKLSEKTDLLIYCWSIIFDVTLADFEQIINNDFIKLEAG